MPPLPIRAEDHLPVLDKNCPATIIHCSSTLCNREKRPDYLWNGKLWDLKTATTEKSANSAIRHGLRQIWNNPGGIILDYRGKQIDLSVLQNVIQKRLWWTENYPGMDIMVVLGDDDVRVWRYAEKK